MRGSCHEYLPKLARVSAFEKRARNKLFEWQLASDNLMRIARTRALIKARVLVVFSFDGQNRSLKIT